MEEITTEASPGVSSSVSPATRALARWFTMLDANDYGAMRNFYEQSVMLDRQQIVLSAVSRFRPCDTMCFNHSSDSLVFDPNLY